MQLLQEDRIRFKRLCQEIVERPRRIEAQPCERAGAHMLLEDWMIIEVCKYFFNGSEDYAGDPPPRRLEGNPLFSKLNVAREADELWAKAEGNVEAIIYGIRKQREGGA